MDTQRQPSFLWPLPMQKSQVKYAPSAELWLLCVFNVRRDFLCGNKVMLSISWHIVLITD